jgi:ribosomal-protein-alanine N-acetyltransferase
LIDAGLAFFSGTPKIGGVGDADDNRGARVQGGVELCPARLQESESIAFLSRDVIEPGLAWVWRPTAIAREIIRPETEVVVARDEGAVVGFGIMRFFDDDAHLILLGVARSRQSEGIGTRLLEYLEKCARTAGITSISLEVRASNQEARSFYRARGYREVRLIRRYYQQTEDAVRMSKRWGDSRRST